jgi:hypothetical protein
MRFRNLKKWKNLADCELLLFSAQLIEELLFDFSLDTYKPSAMNTSLLCVEALNTIIDIEKGVIDKNNLDHILSEFVSNLRRDAVVKSIVSTNIEQSIKILSNKEIKIAEKKLILELLYSELRLSEYKKENENLLSLALKNNVGKNEVRGLIRSYITTLKNSGFSSKYLLDKSLDYFYYGTENEIVSNQDIDQYISLFNSESKEYFSVFKASNLFSEISDSCQKLDILVNTEDEKYEKLLKAGSLSPKGEDQVYVIVENIKAKDKFSARERSEERIDLMSTLLTLYHHKEHPQWDSECLVVEKEPEICSKVESPMNPMHRCIDLKPEKASKRLNAMINGFSLKNTSFRKFSRSSELHSLALNSESRENQIINLWIALESLIPESSDKSKISNLTDCVMPFLNIAYIERILKRFIADIYNWKKGALNKHLKGISGNSLQVRVAKLLVLEKYRDKKDAIFSDFGDFVLLRNRAYYLGTLLKNGKSMTKMLKSHDERVRWQIRRIYRTRNKIVHTGVTPSYTSILIENLHDYLDVVMSTLVNLASDGVKINTLEQGFKYVELQYHSYYEKLQSAQADTFSEEDISNNLFGEKGDRFIFS